MVVGLFCYSGQQTNSFGQTQINAAAPGQAIHREILGSTLAHGRYVVTGDKASQIGVAGGLEAELFNWQTLQNNYQWPTYGFMKTTQNMDSMFMPIVNMRGVYDSGNNYKTDLAPLVTLASDWVRYSNFIIQNYHQGDPVGASDQAILNKINWTAYPQKLPAVGETAPPPVKYWIIGNEPEIKVNGKWFSSNFIDTTFGGAWTTAEYVNRYTQLTSAMKAQDPTIKVGPGMLGGANEDTFGPLLQSTAPIDFWAYHIYDNISDSYVPNGSASQVNAMEAQLRGVRPTQINRHNEIRQTFINNGRNPDNVEFMVTEWNVMNGDLNDANIPSMYQALGTAETFFSFAAMGLKAGNYWGETVYQPDVPNPTNIYPMVKVWWKLRDEMGDTLVNSIIDDANNRHIYTTRDSQTGEIKVWGINLDNDAATSINLSLLGINASSTATLSIFGGDGTKFWTTDANWSSQTLNNFNAGNFNLSIPSASIALLEIHPVPEPAMIGLLGLGLLAMGRRRRQSDNLN
jgi:alpha-L-arabinofuranosidase